MFTALMRRIETQQPARAAAYSCVHGTSFAAIDTTPVCPFSNRQSKPEEGT
jgi:hypothetical protein